MNTVILTLLLPSSLSTEEWENIIRETLGYVDPLKGITVNII